MIHEVVVFALMSLVSRKLTDESSFSSPWIFLSDDVWGVRITGKFGLEGKRVF